MPDAALYSATKAAVENLTQGISAELGPRKIRVNAIAPGYTRSEGTEAAGFLSEERVKRHLSVTPLGRLGEPEDIAAVAVFPSIRCILLGHRRNHPGRRRRPLKQMCLSFSQMRPADKPAPLAYNPWTPLV